MLLAAGQFCKSLLEPGLPAQLLQLVNGSDMMREMPKARIVTMAY